MAKTFATFRGGDQRTPRHFCPQFSCRCSQQKISNLSKQTSIGLILACFWVFRLFSFYWHSAPLSYQHFNLRPNIPVSIVSPNITGLMSKDDFTKLASPYLPESSLDEFTDNTFKLFDEVTAIMSTSVDDFFDENNSEWTFWQGPWRPAWLWGVCLSSACHRDQGQPGAPRLDFWPHFWPSEILKN